MLHPRPEGRGFQVVITYAEISDMTSPDPSIDDDISIVWMAVVYERLIMYNPYNDSFIPELAVRWEKSSDNLTWTFYLRKDAKFHDGTPVNADAVIFSIMRTKELGLGASYIWGAVDRIEKIDDYTVRFHLKYPAPLDLIASASYGAYIFSPRIVEYAGASNATDPRITDWFNAGNDAGSGPYRLVKWDPRNEVVLEKYPDWWGWRDPNHPFKSSIDKAPDIFIIKIVRDATVQERMLLSGEVQIAEEVPVDDIETLKSNPKLVVVTYPSFEQPIVLLNTKKPPLDNVLVRRAIAHAIDYDAIVKTARRGLARVASGPVSSLLWGHADNLTYSYNLTLAKELLAQAGYPNGIDRPLILTYPSGVIFMERSAQVIQASLAKIGIRVELKPMNWLEQMALAQKGWEDPGSVQDMFMFWWWITYPSPYDSLYFMFHSESKEWNLCYYENKRFEELLAEARRYEGIDRSIASKLYIEAQKILYEDVPGIPLFDMMGVKVALTSVKNLDKAINPLYNKVIFPQVLEVGD